MCPILWNLTGIPHIGFCLAVFAREGSAIPVYNAVSTGPLPCGFHAPLCVETDVTSFEFQESKDVGRNVLRCCLN